MHGSVFLVTFHLWSSGDTWRSFHKRSKYQPFSLTLHCRRSGNQQTIIDLQSIWRPQHQISFLPGWTFRFQPRQSWWQGWQFCQSPTKICSDSCQETAVKHCLHTYDVRAPHTKASVAMVTPRTVMTNQSLLKRITIGKPLQWICKQHWCQNSGDREGFILHC